MSVSRPRSVKGPSDIRWTAVGVTQLALPDLRVDIRAVAVAFGEA
jgi:enamine deaminase RidA (YjgF/YER057c/UK114 family)